MHSLSRAGCGAPFLVQRGRHHLAECGRLHVALLPQLVHVVLKHKAVVPGARQMVFSLPRWHSTRRRPQKGRRRAEAGRLRSSCGNKECLQGRAAATMPGAEQVIMWTTQLVSEQPAFGLQLARWLARLHTRKLHVSIKYRWLQERDAGRTASAHQCSSRPGRCRACRVS